MLHTHWIASKDYLTTLAARSENQISLKTVFLEEKLLWICTRGEFSRYFFAIFDYGTLLVHRLYKKTSGRVAFENFKPSLVTGV